MIGRDARPGDARNGAIAAMAAAGLWGFTGVFVQALAPMPATLIAAARLTVAFAALAPFALAHAADFRRGVTWRAGALMALYYVLATIGFAKAPVVDVALILGCAPAVALVLDVVRGARPGKRRLAGVALALLGLAFYLLPSRSGEAFPEAAIGRLFAGGAATASALLAATLRGAASQGAPLAPVAMAAAASLVGACVAFAAGAVFGDLPSGAAASAIPLVVGLGLLCTALPTLAFGYASSRLAPTVTTGLQLLTPLSAGLAAGFILGRWPSIASLPGALVVLLGLRMLIGHSDSTQPRESVA